MGIKIGVQELPKNALTPPEEGVYYLKVEDIVEENSKEWGQRIVMSHQIVGTAKKINFDSYRIKNADGTPHEWGRGKLATFLDAIELPEEVEEITVPILKTFAVGKYIKANLKSNDKNYLNINFADIYSINDPRETLNELPKEENPNNQIKEEVSKEIKEAVEEDEVVVEDEI